MTRYPIPELKLPPGEGKRLYGVSLALFALALLCKGTVVTMPVVLLGCAWWQRRKVGRKDVLRTAPFFALAAIIGLVTIWFEHQPETGKIAFDAGGPLVVG